MPVVHKRLIFRVPEKNRLEFIQTWKNLAPNLVHPPGLISLTLYEDHLDLERLVLDGVWSGFKRMEDRGNDIRLRSQMLEVLRLCPQEPEEEIELPLVKII